MCIPSAMLKYTKNIVIKLGQKIEQVVRYLMTLDSDHQGNEVYLIIRVQILDRSHYFGPFPSVQYAEKWLVLNHIDHLKYEMIDVSNPALARDEWPF